MMVGITQTRLKELLHYEPDTGLFRRLVSNTNRAVSGSVAGSMDGHGYVDIGIERRKYKAHRLAFLYMTGAFPPELVDHINGDRGDNRWQNLRPATASQNIANQGPRKNSKTGVKGVFQEGSRFRTHIMTGGRQVEIGRFDTVSEAKASYDNAANDLHGEFARSA